MNQIDLQGRHAVVTGGAQGIGRAVAERLIKSGASVAIWDRDLDLANETAQEIGATAFQADVTNQVQVETAYQKTIDRQGKVDLLFANAGITGPNKPLWEYPPDTWREVIDVSLFGVFLCCRAVVPGMIAQNYGRIVNMASIAGKEGNPNASAYSAAKAGIIALTKSLGKELASYNIAVNCLTPAVAKTRLFEQMTEQHIAYMLSKIPRARFVEVQEIAAMAAWLFSEENSFTTGAVFDISGGRATY